LTALAPAEPASVETGETATFSNVSVVAVINYSRRSS
jgi:hypothetical protein